MKTASIFDERALAAVRRAYAMQMLALNGIRDDPALEAAFAVEPRERYLGPPPWRVARAAGPLDLPEPDPVLAYQDVLFALAPERGVNNGSPSLHARWLHRARLKEGAHAVHLGAGTGYYTALLARLVGPGGRVTAVEFDPRLADRARANLGHHPNAVVVDGDGADWPREAADCVYVNFSVERPAGAWLDRLNVGGRLVFPLGVPGPRRASGGRHALHGAGFVVERRGADAFSADWLGPAYFVCAEGGDEAAADAAESAALKAAFERGGVEFVRSLRWRCPPAPSRFWHAGPGWSLSYDAVAGSA